MGITEIACRLLQTRSEERVSNALEDLADTSGASIGHTYELRSVDVRCPPGRGIKGHRGVRCFYSSGESRRKVGLVVRERHDESREGVDERPRRRSGAGIGEERVQRMLQ